MFIGGKKNPFVLCQALFQQVANPFPSSQLTFLSSSTASENGLHLPHAVFCSKSPESSTCYEHQRIQRPKTRKNKSTEKSAHARYGATTASLSPSLSLSTGLGSTDYWRDDKYRYETSSVRYGVV